MQANIDSAVYYYGLVQERRENPQDDMINRLIAAEVPGENGELRKLDDIEITGFLTLLGGAGAETVTKLVGSAVVEFARHPEQWQKLLDDRSKIPDAVEELLRYVGPVQYNVRYSIKDVELPSGIVPANKPVFLMGAAANRDPRAFEDAETFDIDPRPQPGAEPRARLRHPQLPRCRAGPHGERDRARAPARLHASLRGRLPRPGTRAHAERRRLPSCARKGVAVTQKVVVDFGLCESNGVCMGIIPEVFDLDDQDYLHILQDEVTPENEQQIREAVRQCPRQAISIADE